MLPEKILSLPGFLYELDGKYYYLGKWICKECTDTDASDCAVMYTMCRSGREEPDTNMYFQKTRAYSDFALEVPYNPAKIKDDVTAIVNGLSEKAAGSLETQIQHFEEDLKKYC